ncbi:hypothetical protein EN816_04625 [Mesorhizobium sp. M8A.F.Ca.ET.173.01.1.1]|nr:hypothetical protein EOA30_28795 [Mesorhizobium sp. M8A.F.Ca.ET.059.01.1.1]TGV16515.1 hypothetical protein EN816_04625 [Mesorhizobium sp. M8A.F.Ca.ET.173.01.1.1]
MKAFDWHADPILRATPITKSYRNTQNAGRFLTRECGVTFRFDRPFMAWLKDGREKTKGDAADDRLKSGKRSCS